MHDGAFSYRSCPFLVYAWSIVYWRYDSWRKHSCQWCLLSLDCRFGLGWCWSVRVFRLGLLFEGRESNRACTFSSLQFSPGRGRVFCPPGVCPACTGVTPPPPHSNLGLRFGMLIIPFHAGSYTALSVRLEAPYPARSSWQWRRLPSVVPA